MKRKGIFIEMLCEAHHSPPPFFCFVGKGGGVGVGTGPLYCPVSVPTVCDGGFVYLSTEAAEQGFEVTYLSFILEDYYDGVYELALSLVFFLSQRLLLK